MHRAHCGVSWKTTPGVMEEKERERERERERDCGVVDIEIRSFLSIASLDFVFFAITFPESSIQSRHVARNSDSNH